VNFAEFEIEISALRKKFGDKSFDSTKVGLIYEVVRDLTQKQFKHIVEKFIGEDHRAFKVEAKNFKRFEGRGECAPCSDSGWLILRDKMPTQTIRCYCNGGARSQEYLDAKDEHESLEREFKEKGWE